MNKNAMLTLDIEKVDLEIAARVAQRYVLKDIYLVGGKISRDPLTVSPETLSLEHKCSTESLTPFDAEKRIFLCNFRVAAFDGQEPNKLIMKIEASFCTSYVDTSQPDPLIPEDDLDFLLEYHEYIITINPISHAWPYWREFVQNMSSRMGFPALTVPLLEIALKKPATKRSKSQPAKKESTRRKKLSA
ncbi:MAG: hypothetical protein ABIG94_13085 [Pseudomonadota bacterium]